MRTGLRMLALLGSVSLVAAGASYGPTLVAFRTGSLGPAGEFQSATAGSQLARIHRALLEAEEQHEQRQDEAAGRYLAEAEREWAQLTSSRTGGANPNDPEVGKIRQQLERVRQLLSGRQAVPPSAPPVQPPNAEQETSGRRAQPTGTTARSGGARLAPTPYPRFHVDQFNRGQSRYRGPQTNRVKWRFNLHGGATAGSPALGSDGTLYFGDSQSTFYALSPQGTARWTFRLPPTEPPSIGWYGKVLGEDEKREWRSLKLGGKIMNAPAIAADGTIYFGVSEGVTNQRLYALGPDGKERWSFRTDADIISSPNLDANGIIYFKGADAKLYAVDGSGRLKWTYQLPNARKRATWSTPAIGEDGTIYVVGGDLYALQPDGRVKWTFSHEQLRSAFASNPVVGMDGAIYLGAADSLLAVRPDGTLKWIKDIGWSETSAAIGSDGTIYLGTGTVRGRKPAFYAVRPGDGSIKWTFPIKVAVDSSPAVGADGTVYFGSDDGLFYAVDAGGKPKWTAYTGEKGEVDMAPTISADGTLYYATLVGDSQGPAVFAIADKP